MSEIIALRLGTDATTGELVIISDGISKGGDLGTALKLVELAVKAANNPIEKAYALRILGSAEIRSGGSSKMIEKGDRDFERALHVEDEYSISMLSAGTRAYLRIAAELGWATAYNPLYCDKFRVHLNNAQHYLDSTSDVDWPFVVMFLVTHDSAAIKDGRFRPSVACPDNIPDNTAQRELSNSQDSTGDMQEAQGDLAAALMSYQASLTIRERLAKAQPGNLDWQSGLSVSYENIGGVHRAQGDLAAALMSYQASLAIRQRLANAQPGNPGWQTDLSVSYDKIGRVQGAQGDSAAALASYQASLAIKERLLEADPGNTAARRSLALTYAVVGFSEMRQGAHDDAIKAFREGREIIVQLLVGFPDNATYLKDLDLFDKAISTHDK